MSMKMRCVCWLSAAVVLWLCGSAVDAQRWKPSDCGGLDSLDRITESAWQCRLKQLVSSTENLLTHLQQSHEEDEDVEKNEEEDDRPSLSILLPDLSRDDVSRQQLPSVRPQRSGDRQTYSMQHFRWGKPVSFKRRPVKVHASVSADDEDPEGSMVTAVSSIDRRQLQEGQEKNTNMKSTGKYRITHFRWSAPPTTPPAAPPTAKRYGGFMKSWSESSHKPLLTLLRNIINQNRQ